MSKRERKQVEIGQLARSVNACGVDVLSIEQTDVVGPELMQMALSRLGKTLDDGLHGQRIGICGMGHDSNAAVLGDRTGRPSVGPRMASKPFDGARVRRVSGVQ